MVAVTTLAHSLGCPSVGQLNLASVMLTKTPEIGSKVALPTRLPVVAADHGFKKDSLQKKAILVP